jgi:SAM-dependent methyltransferase
MDRARLDRERSFHDDRFTDDGDRAAAKKYYSVTRASSARLDEILTRVPAGARALELGCGVTNHTEALASRGVDVVAIDLSPVAVMEMGQRLQDAGLDANTCVEVMNAEELGFDARSFDLVVGTGILHHLVLDRAFEELSRVLRPDGVAVFVEPLGTNPMINGYRALTPRMRTPDEHPLVPGDFDAASRYFGRVEVEHFHATSLAAVALRGTKAFDPVLARLESLDQRLFDRRPASRRLAWSCVLSLREPKGRDPLVRPVPGR